MEILIGIGVRLIDELNRCVDTSNHIPDYWSRGAVQGRRERNSGPHWSGVNIIYIFFFSGVVGLWRILSL